MRDDPRDPLDRMTAYWQREKDRADALAAELATARARIERLRHLAMIAKYTLPGSSRQDVFQKDLAAALRCCGTHGDLADPAPVGTPTADGEGSS